MPGVLDSVAPAGLNPGLLSAQNLVNANAPATMNPSAIQALTDSMRSGAITAQDIIDRAGEHGKTKRKAEIELHKRAIADLQDPNLDAARKAVMLAQGKTAELQGAQAQAALPNVQLGAQTQEAQLKASLWDAQVHGAGLGQQQKVLEAAGWPVTPGSATDMNAEINRRYQAVLQHSAEVANTKDFLAKTDKTDMMDTTSTDAAGRKVVIAKPVISYGGRVYDPTTRDAAQRFLSDPVNLSPQTWDAKGKPRSPVMPAPGEATPMVQPKTSAVAPPPPPSVEVQTPGATLPNGSIVKSVEQRPEKVPTEAQGRAKLALERFAVSNDMFEALKSVGFDPTSVGSWIGGMLPELIKPDNVKAYDAAKSAWAQGLLRLESGAAISDSEKAWYAKAFFPSVGDPPQVVAQKEALRSGTERMVLEMAQAGQADTPESIALTNRLIRDKVNSVAGVPAGTAAAPTGVKMVDPTTGRPATTGGVSGMTKGNGSMFSIDGGKTWQWAK